VQFLHNVSHGAKFDGELKAKFKAQDFNFTLSGNQKEDLSFEVSPAKAISGLKPTLTLSSNTKNLLEKFQLKASTEVRREWLFGLASLDFPQKSAGGTEKEASEVAPNLVISTVVGSKPQGLSAGLDLQFDTSSKELKNLHSVLSYSASDLEVSVFCKSKIGKQTNIGANYYQRLMTRWKDAAVAGQVSYPLGGSTPSFALGGFFKPDSSSSIKSRITEKGLAGISYTQQWGGPFSVSFSSEVNLLELQEAAQFGVKFSIK